MIHDREALQHFHELSHRLLRAAKNIADPELIQGLNDFLTPYSGTDQGLPRSAHELLTAQILGRRILTETGDYGLVYDWYYFFKNPHGEDIDKSIEYYIQSIRSGAKAVRWIEGYESVVECGCGAAALGLALAQYNKKWIASDISRPAALDRLIKVFSPGPAFEFAIMNGITLDELGDESIQAIVSRSFFEHLLPDDALTHLASAHRVLKPGGELIISCPAGVGPPSDITNRFPQYDTAQGLHIKEYRLVEMSEMLKNAGFTAVNSRFIRTRFVSNLPLPIQRRNTLPVGMAAVLESAAGKTWPMVKKSYWGSRFWRKFWGHLGAAGIMLIARKA